MLRASLNPLPTPAVRRGSRVADDQRDLPALAEEAQLAELPMVAQLLALSTPEHSMREVYYKY